MGRLLGMDAGAKRTSKNNEEAGWEEQSVGRARGHETRAVTRGPVPRVSYPVAATLRVLILFLNLCF